MGHNNNDSGAHLAKERDIAFSGEYTNILLEMLVQYGAPRHKFPKSPFVTKNRKFVITYCCNALGP